MNLIEIKGQGAKARTRASPWSSSARRAWAATSPRICRSTASTATRRRSPARSATSSRCPCRTSPARSRAASAPPATRGLGKQIFTHGPITVGGCLPCHDYQSFPNKYELRTAGGGALLLLPRPGPRAGRQASYIHGPVAAGFCVVCHDPHGANERFLLLKKADRLCLSCHQDLLQGACQALHAQADRGQGSCTGCHDPHAANASKLLVLPRETSAKSATISRQCGTCTRSGSPRRRSSRRGPRSRKEGTTTCYTCHFFHASSQPKLWRGPQEQCGSGLSRHAVQRRGRGAGSGQGVDGQGGRKRSEELHDQSRFPAHGGLLSRGRRLHERRGHDRLSGEQGLDQDGRDGNGHAQMAEDLAARRRELPRTSSATASSGSRSASPARPGSWTRTAPCSTTPTRSFARSTSRRRRTSATSRWCSRRRRRGPRGRARSRRSSSTSPRNTTRASAPTGSSARSGFSPFAACPGAAC